MDMEKIGGQKKSLSEYTVYLELLGFRRQKFDIIFVENLTITTIVRQIRSSIVPDCWFYCGSLAVQKLKRFGEHQWILA